MSRMTKYLHQRCEHEALNVDEKEEPILNQYGEPEYLTVVTVKCRRERSAQDVETTDGRIVRSTSVYYIDEKTVLRVNDKLDGKVVLNLTEYTGSTGKSEGWMAYV